MRATSEARHKRRADAAVDVASPSYSASVQLNLHFDVLVFDGAFDADGVLVADEAPDDDDVQKLLLRAGRKVITMLRRFFDEHGDDDPRRREIDRLFASLDAASATPLLSLFPRTERRAPLSAFIDSTPRWY